MNELKEQLDNIDNQIYDEVFDGYLNSRLRVLIGMWDKGKIVYEYRGVKSYRDLEKESERDKNSLKRWYDIYKKYPNKEDYIEKYAKQKAITWTQKAIEDKKTAHVSQSTGENEWYTPQNIIESARNVMGNINLDPASSELANQTIKADSFYTKEINGLEQDWYGNVWLNPPYSQPEINHFSQAIFDKRNEFNQICILVNNATETEWLQRILKICDGCCFMKSRIKFIDIDGNPGGAPLQGQVIIYIGKNSNSFFQEFKKYGICMKIINQGVQ